MNAALGAPASVALAGLVALAAYSASFVLALAVALVVLATALGWSALFDLPSPLGSAVLVAVAGWAGVALALAVQHQARPLAWFAALVAALRARSPSSGRSSGARRARRSWSP